MFKDWLNIRYKNLLDIAIVFFSNFELMSSQPAEAAMTAEDPALA